MMKARRPLANSIRIIFASLFLCLFAALPAFATDGIYTQFGLDLGYAGRIGYTGPEWAIYVYGAGTASNPFGLSIFPLRWVRPLPRSMAILPWQGFTARLLSLASR